MADDRLLIAGLGNPGTKYEKTRHNAGFLAVDHFAGEFGEQVSTEKMQGLCSTLRMKGKQIFLLKPQTYMNRSGECIVRFVQYYDILPEHILMIHDDLDLDAGRLKMVFGGGAGGHKGILSTIRHLGTNEFCRLRIGIGRPAVPDTGPGLPVEKFVLSRFSGEEWGLFQDNLDKIAEGIRLFIDQGVEAAMNRINARNRLLPGG